ncbi:MAG TPA: hypothetical protein VF644_08785 [Pyrinomonadaceae bacterium]|jgi:hypothetical protein
MSYGVFCTFDLKNASSQDYQNAYADLEKIGLKKVVVGSNRNVVIPTTAVLGNFNGVSTTSVRDYVLQKIAEVFKVRKLKSEVFVFIGSETTWISQTT